MLRVTTIHRLVESGSDDSQITRGVNINDSTAPWTELILSGKKTIETRDKLNNAFAPLVGQRVAIVRTGVGNTKVVGYVTVGRQIHYTTVEQFRADQDKHRVRVDSHFDFKGEKYGYVMVNPVREPEPFAPVSVSRKYSVVRHPGAVVTEATGKNKTTMKQTETPAFKAWFSGSKVVDKKGKPLVMYHGTSSASDFSVFNTDGRDMGSHFGTANQASHLSNTGWDERGLSPRTIPVYLSIKKPLRLVDRGHFEPSGVASQLVDIGIMEDDGSWDYDTVTMPYVRAAITRAGYDGIVYLNRREGLSQANSDGVAGEDLMDDHEFLNAAPEATDSYIAFHPTQIKSAIGNKGGFDPKKDDIRESSAKSTHSTKPRGQTLAEASNPTRHQLWYHGTSEKMGRQIAKDGKIIPGKVEAQDSYEAASTPGYIYLTNDYNIAEQYARRRGRGRAIVTVNAADIPWDKAEPDEEVLCWMLANWASDKSHGNEKYDTPEDLLKAYGPDDKASIRLRADMWRNITQWIQTKAPQEIQDDWKKVQAQWDRCDPGFPPTIIKHLPRGSALWDDIMRSCWSIRVPAEIPVAKVETRKSPKAPVEIIEPGHVTESTGKYRRAAVQKLTRQITGWENHTGPGRYYFRIQPAGMGLKHRSRTSNDNLAHGLHVFDTAYQARHPDGWPSFYGNEVVVILGGDSWDNGDVEGVEIDPAKARIVARIPWDDFAQAVDKIQGEE